MITNKSFIERSVQFEEEPLATVEVGESSSPPHPLIVSEETNEFSDSDMSDNDDLFHILTFIQDQNGQKIPFMQLGNLLQILVTLGGLDLSSRVPFVSKILYLLRSDI